MPWKASEGNPQNPYRIKYGDRCSGYFGVCNAATVKAKTEWARHNNTFCSTLNTPFPNSGSGAAQHNTHKTQTLRTAHYGPLALCVRLQQEQVNQISALLSITPQLLSPGQQYDCLRAALSINPPASHFRMAMWLHVAAWAPPACILRLTVCTGYP